MKWRLSSGCRHQCLSAVTPLGATPHWPKPWRTQLESPMPFGSHPSRGTRSNDGAPATLGASPMPFGSHPSRGARLRLMHKEGDDYGSPMPFGSHPSRGICAEVEIDAKVCAGHQCLSAVTPLGAQVRQRLCTKANLGVTNAFRQSPLSGRVMVPDWLVEIDESPMPFGSHPSRGRAFITP